MIPKIHKGKVPPLLLHKGLVDAAHQHKYSIVIVAVHLK